MSLSSEEVNLVLSGFSVSTRRAYEASWIKFQQFCLRHKFSLCPAVPITVVKFLNFELSENHASAAALRVHAAAISAYHKLSSMPNPCSSFIVSQALKGACRLRPAALDNRLPVSSSIMTQLLVGFHDIVLNPYEDTAFAALLHLLYSGWFRICELLSSSKSVPDARLRGSGVTIIDNSIVVQLLFDKTSKGRIRRMNLPCSSDGFDHHIAIQKFLDKKPVSHRSEDFPFFVHENGVPITVGQFRPLLTRVVEAKALPKEISSHSFRIGGASRAAFNGVSMPVIMTRGRWRADQCARRYVRSL